MTETDHPSSQSRSSLDFVKVLTSVGLFILSFYTVNDYVTSRNGNDVGSERRRLSVLSSENYYVSDLKQELRDREKLFEDAKPGEIKYWFEYAGPLQVSVVHVSQSRSKYIS